MITFFTHCRPFEGEFDKLQRTAISSWYTAMSGNCQILMLGQGANFSFPYTYSDGVEVNDQGTALVSSIFDKGERFAAHDLLCEISSDIVLGGDFWNGIRAIADIDRPFVVGQRWDIEPGAAASMAKLHPPSATDYFIFRRGTLGEIPPFAVGRTAYDNWLIWAAMEQWGLTVIDATEAITAIHVNHGYPEYGTKEKMIASQERQENNRLMVESAGRCCQVTDAPYVIRRGEVVSR